MGKFGEVLGWAAAICYITSMVNFVFKEIYKKKIIQMPKDSLFRKNYQILMKWIVKWHRYFGMAAGILGVFHLIWQIINVRVSYSGIFATLLMTAAVLLGISMAYKKKTNLIKTHRAVSISLLLVGLVHIITKV